MIFDFINTITHATFQARAVLINAGQANAATVILLRVAYPHLCVADVVLGVCEESIVFL